jgi:tetratricopeptide (TPR) repeat protein
MATVSADSRQAPHAEPEPAPAPAAVQAELLRVLAGPVFAHAQSHQRLLRYLVENSLAGRSNLLKETVLGIEVFYRPAAQFDPRRDSIVRVEARRLRERLAQHYAAHADSALVISLPKGSYRPQFVQQQPVLPTPPSPAQQHAQELLDRGLFFLRQGHEAGHRKALARFEAAVAAAPEMADAHNGVARAWTQLVATNIEPPYPGVHKAQAAVQQALALAPRHAEALVLAAQLAQRFDFDWPRARALFAQALAAAPQSAYVRHSHAMALMMRGDFADAQNELTTARRFDPLNLGLRAHLGLLALYQRQWAQAESSLQELLDMAPDNVLGLSLLAYVALCRGDAAQALALYQQVSALHPALSIGRVGEVLALAALARVPEARQRLRALHKRFARAGRAYLSPYQLAMAEIWLGHADPALDLLQQAVQERDPNALCLPVDPAFDALAAVPRFVALRAQVLGDGLSAVPGAAGGASSTT